MQHKILPESLSLMLGLISGTRCVQVSSISSVESLIKMVRSQIFRFIGSTQITSAVRLHPWGDSDSAIVAVCCDFIFFHN